ncbi:MAG: dihydropteroate synthase [Lentisphaeria bacterium]|nr:dihydropteroate synthase [Lentisphaeria bacterium]
MGIANATPDSFSDGGEFADVAACVSHSLSMISEGASIIDVGGESTRPGHTPVDAETELSRVIPVVRALRGASDIPISVDTSKAVVARESLLAGADIVNDVSGGSSEMYAVLKEFGAGCVLMDGHNLEQHADVLAEVRASLLALRDKAISASGLSCEHFLLDPGVGFGKDAAQNLCCVRHAAEFTDGRSGVLLGVSRKSFIGTVADEPIPLKRLPGTLACGIIGRHCAVLRVHDVAAHKQALTIANAILGPN